MDNIAFEERKKTIVATYEQLITRKNYPLLQVDNGIYKRYEHPVVTAAHAPYFWKYDLNPETNPFLEERFGVNAAFNAGAIYLNGKFLLVVRVEGADRKSFFAVAESENGVDNFRFWEKPILLPKSDPTETNIYDMRLTAHADGWIYGVFCVEKKDPEAPASDKSSAIAQCGIVRTKDLKNWERLPDLKTSSPQQRNVVLHSEFVHGKYAFYTRPQDGFISTGSGGGIGFGLSDTIENPYVAEESIVDARHYHTISELKNGLGPAPIKTKEGWLHLAHGVRNTAAGLRYVLYLFMTSLEDPSKILYKPAGCFMAPEGEERIGDVSNVLFSNGWIVTEDGQIYIYYASSDTRMHVATSTIAQLVDYVKNTAPDGLYSNASVSVIHSIMEHNKGLY